MNPWALSLAGGFAVVFAALMAMQRSLYLAAVCLLVVLLQTAALFFISGAPLLAFLQIMIYAGAVMVMIVVTIMAAPAAAPRRTAGIWATRPSAFIVLAGLGAALAAVIAGAHLPEGTSGAAVPMQSALGSILFGPYAVATEAVTLLMLLASLALVGRKS